MIKILCKHTSLVDVDSSYPIDRYEKLVRPLDYEFDLIQMSTYKVVGFLERDGTSWLYVVSETLSEDIQIVPAVLFDFPWSSIPINWAIRIPSNNNLGVEILPQSLSLIDNWYEKYIDGDELVMGVIEQCI